MQSNNHSYYPAVLSGGYVWVAPTNIPKKVAVAILKQNSSTGGVFTLTSTLAIGLCSSLGGTRGPEKHGSTAGYWYHYHPLNYLNAHCGFTFTLTTTAKITATGLTLTLFATTDV